MKNKGIIHCTMNHPARIQLLPHTGDVVVAQDGCIKGINSFPGKLRRVSLYTYEVNDDSVKGDNFLLQFHHDGILIIFNISIINNHYYYHFFLHSYSIN